MERPHHKGKQPIDDLSRSALLLALRPALRPPAFPHSTAYFAPLSATYFDFVKSFTKSLPEGAICGLIRWAYFDERAERKIFLRGPGFRGEIRAGGR